MKLNYQGLVRYAFQHSIGNVKDLARRLGIKKYPILTARVGLKVGNDLVRDVYNHIGEDEVLQLIDFEEETLDGFKAKYIQIGNKLY